ncbi:hypothetical protein BG74_04760 [Sodalis-like endosymbiont of Proechinophthirus fluctus]|nr:hypothetical protein BG74_04760 [Sodalis-like endosymbiont of Proechinophthirus fluctus]
MIPQYKYITSPFSLGIITIKQGKSGNGLQQMLRMIGVNSQTGRHQASKAKNEASFLIIRKVVDINDRYRL